MTDSYFFDDGQGYEADAGDIRHLARRQFVFSLAIGALLIFCAALIGSRSLMGGEPPLALHQMMFEAPAASQSAATQG
jgi:hypothetical protein